MKLETVLAIELPLWPDWNPEFAYCDKSGEIRFRKEIVCDFFPEHNVDIADRGFFGYSIGQKTVNSAQWEAERTRIAINQQATQEAREIARTGAMTNEEQELADIACGKRSKEDQELWDKVAIAAAPIFYQECMIDFRHGSGFLYKETMEDVGDFADAFMAEREKRMKW